MNKLLIQEPPLQVLPSLATHIGLNEAIIIQQLHYWLRTKHAKEKDGKRWVYNTFDQWHSQLPFWSKRTIRRTFNSLEKDGYIITGNFNSNAWDRTKWYTLNYLKLKELQENPPAENGCPDETGQADLMVEEQKSPAIGTKCPHHKEQRLATETNTEINIYNKSTSELSKDDDILRLIEFWNKIEKPKIELKAHTIMTYKNLVQEILHDPECRKLEIFSIRDIEQLVRNYHNARQLPSTRAWKSTLKELLMKLSGGSAEAKQAFAPATFVLEKFVPEENREQWRRDLRRPGTDETGCTRAEKAEITRRLLGGYNDGEKIDPGHAWHFKKPLREAFFIRGKWHKGLSDKKDMTKAEFDDRCRYHRITEWENQR